MSAGHKTLTARYGSYTRVNIMVLLLSQVLAWILIKILTLGFTQTDFGTLSTLISIGSLIGMFFSSFLANNIWRYAERFQSEGKGDQLAALLYGVIFITIILDIVVFGFIILSYNFLNLNILGLSEEFIVVGLIATSAFIFVTSLYTALVSLAHGLQNVNLILVVSLTNGFAQIVGTILVIYSSGPVLSIIMINSLLMGLTFGFILFKILRKLQKPKHILSILKHSVSFSGPLALRNFFTAAVPTSIIYFAFMWSEPAMAAIVSVGISVIALLTESIRSVYVPFRQYAISEFEKSDDEELSKKNISETSILLLELLLMGAFWLLILAPEIVSLLATPQYIDASNYVRYAAFGAVILWLGYTYGTTGSYIAERTYMETISAALGLVTLVIGIYLLLPLHGLVGLAIAYSISCIVTGGINLVSGTLFFGLLIPTKAICKLIVVSLIAGSIFILVSSLSGNYLISGLIATSIFLLIQIRFGPLEMKHFQILVPFSNRKEMQSEVQ